MERTDGGERGRVSTGIEMLDGAMGGGIRPGSLVAVSALPRTQSEPLLYAVAGANPTRYLSTLRPTAEVEEALARVVPDAGATDVTVSAVDGDEVLSDPEAAFRGLSGGGAVVVDPTTELEQGDRERYRSILDTCKRAVRMTDSVAVFHCHENTPSVLRRDMTLARADQVWDVRTEVLDGEVRTQLAVTKCRGGVPFGVLDLAFDPDGGVAVQARRE